MSTVEVYHRPATHRRNAHRFPDSGGRSDLVAASGDQALRGPAGGAAGAINVKASPYNAQINGITDDTAAFKAAYQAAPAGSVIHVPNGVTVLQNPNTWGIPLTKRVKWIVDGTSLHDGTPLSNAIPAAVDRRTISCQALSPETAPRASRSRRLAPSLEISPSSTLVHSQRHRWPNGRRGQREFAQ